MKLRPCQETAIWSAWLRTKSKRRTMRETGHAWPTVDRVVTECEARIQRDIEQRRERIAAGQPLPPPDLPEVEPFHPPAALPIGSADESPVHSVKGDDAGGQTVELTSDRLIHTLDEAIAFAQVDLSVWRVKDWECTAWQVGMKVRERDGQRVVRETPVKKQLWRVRLRLERLLPKSLHDATEALIRRMEQLAPRSLTLATLGRPPVERTHCWEVDLFDVHIGKLAWRAETGQDYDLRIAQDVFRNAMEDLIARASGFPPERILIPVGNDFFQVDNLQSATTKGTRVDSDGRYAKIIELGTASLIEGIVKLLAIAPVEVLWIPGNHDRLSSYHLCREIKAWFRHADVTVDVGPSPRKYFEHGMNLVGFTHGDREKERSLAAIMMTEAADRIRKGQHREFHVGHTHRSKVSETMPVNEEDGFTVRRLASLSATDAWHHENGYVGSRRAAEVFVWSKEPGITGHFYVNARTSATSAAGPRLYQPEAA